mmetsp:Transcript_25928/g.37957  ORF Transcript_25928/g.37957 Transcript_25928/m.37957 type:complete len:316 (-) Transcript_25928:264-1211(-)
MEATLSPLDKRTTTGAFHGVRLHPFHGRHIIYLRGGVLFDPWPTLFALGLDTFASNVIPCYQQQQVRWVTIVVASVLANFRQTSFTPHDTAIFTEHMRRITTLLPHVWLLTTLPWAFVQQLRKRIYHVFVPQSDFFHLLCTHELFHTTHQLHGLTTLPYWTSKRILLLKAKILNDDFAVRGDTFSAVQVPARDLCGTFHRHGIKTDGTLCFKPTLPMLLDPSTGFHDGSSLAARLSSARDRLSALSPSSCDPQALFKPKGIKNGPVKRFEILRPVWDIRLQRQEHGRPVVLVPLEVSESTVLQEVAYSKRVLLLL